MSTAFTLGQLTSQDLATLRGLVDEWVRTCLDADWDKVTSFLTDDVVFLPPDQPIVQGKSAVKSWFESFPAIKAFAATLEDAEGRGDLASARGTFSLSIEPSPGQRMQITGKWVGLYRKQADGNWLCALDIWNADHPVQPACLGDALEKGVSEHGHGRGRGALGVRSPAAVAFAAYRVTRLRRGLGESRC
ncbi:MAG: YybH family protein [bacterium]